MEALDLNPTDQHARSRLDVVRAMAPKKRKGFILGESYRRSMSTDNGTEPGALAPTFRLPNANASVGGSEIDLDSVLKDTAAL